MSQTYSKNYSDTSRLNGRSLQEQELGTDSHVEAPEDQAIAAQVVDDQPHVASEADNESEGDPEKADKPQSTASKSGFVKRSLLITLGAIALSVGAVSSWRWWQFQQTHVTTDNAQIQGHTSPISAKIPANVQQVLVKEGDHVEAGQPLVILEDPDLNLKTQQAAAKLAVAQAQLQSATDTIPLTNQLNISQVQQAQAKLAASQSTVSAAQAKITQAEAAIEMNQAKVAQAQTELDKAQADFQRYQALYQQGAVSAQQFDVARAAYDNAQANLLAVSRTVTQAQADVQSAQAQLQQALAEAEAARGQVKETQVSQQNVKIQQDQQQLAKAQVAQAQAELALAQQQTAYTIINAPISGYVGELTAQVGQKVQTGQPLVALVPLQTEQVYIEANFKETALAKLKVGEKAEVEIDAYPNQTFEATVAGISPATGANFALIPPDNASGNFNKVVQWVPVRLMFDADADPDHKLRPGLSAKVTVDTTTATHTAILPSKH